MTFITNILSLLKKYIQQILKMKNIFFAIIAVFILTSCNKKDEIINNDNENDVIVVKDFITELYNKSVDTLEIASRKYIIDAELWRDFMPPSPPNGYPLIAINWLLPIDTLQMPNNIDLIEQYVVFNDSIWITGYENNNPPSLHLIIKVSRNGPKWGPHLYVDVFSKIHDSITNIDYFLKKKNVYINRTD